MTRVIRRISLSRETALMYYFGQLFFSEECYRCNKSAYPSSIRNAKSTVDNGVNVTDIEQSEQTPLLTTSLEEKPDSVKQYGMKDNLKLERYYEGEQHQSGRHVIVIMCLNLLMIIVCIYVNVLVSRVFIGHCSLFST